MNFPEHKNESGSSPPTTSQTGAAPSHRRARWLVFRLTVLLLPVAALVGWLYFTSTGKLVSQGFALQLPEYKLLKWTNHEALRDACRKVISDPKVFPTHQLLSSDPAKGKIYRIAPSDPQLPAAIRSLGATSVIVRDDVMIIGLRTHWSFSSLVVFQAGVNESHGYSRKIGYMRIWKELCEGLYYSAGNH